MSAGYVRMISDTGHGGIAELGWSFMRRMIRFTPVRLFTISGGLAGRWIGYELLLMTPMLGTFVNVVCTDPGRWTWLERVSVSKSPAIVTNAEVWVDEEAEVISGRQELWTKGVRNVLIVGSLPRTQAEIDTARKYDCIVVTTEDHLEWFLSKNMIATLIPPPYLETEVKHAILDTRERRTP